MICLSSNTHSTPLRLGYLGRAMGLCLALLFLWSIPLQAQTWVGGGDTESWNDPANWDNNAVPGPGDDVIIDIPGFAILIPGSGSGTMNPIRSLNINTTVSTLRIINGGLLTIDGTGGLNNFGLQIDGGGFIFQVDNGGLLQIQNIDGRGIINRDRANFINEGTVSIENTSSDGLFNEITQDNVVLNFSGNGELLLDNVATANGHGIHNRLGGNTTFNGIINFDQRLVDINTVGIGDGWRNEVGATVNQSVINVATLGGIDDLIINNVSGDGIANIISELSINQSAINLGPQLNTLNISNTGRDAIHNAASNDGLINMELSGQSLLQNIGRDGIHNNAANTSDINMTNSNLLSINGTTGAGIHNEGIGQVRYTNGIEQEINMLNIGTIGIENLDGNLFVNGICAFISTGNTPTGLLQAGAAAFSNLGLLNIAGTVGNDATSAGTFNNAFGRVLVSGGTPAGFAGATPNADASLTDSDGVLDGIGGSLAETAPIHIVANGEDFVNPLVFCEGDSAIVLSIINDSGTGTYEWSNGDSLATISLAALTDSTGLYSVTITDENAGPGCETSVAFISLVVNPAPPAVALGGNTTLEICSDEPAGAGRRVILDDSSPLIDNIQWSLSSSPMAGVLTDFFTIVGPNGRTAEALTTAPAGVYTLAAQTFSADGCASIDTANFTVNINALPTGTIALSQATICEDEAMVNLTFTATAGTGPFTLLLGSDADGDNSFEPADNLNITQNNMGNPLMSGDVIAIQRIALESGGAPGDYEIRLRSITDDNACQQIGIGQDVALSINPAITAIRLRPALAEVCAVNASLQFAVDSLDVGAGLAAPPTGFSYNWSLSDPTLGSFDDASLINPVFTPAAGLAANDQVIATVTVTDADGQCMASFDRQIDLYIAIAPTAIDINTCTSDGMVYNLTLNNAMVNTSGGGMVQWFAGDPDNGGLRIDNLATAGTNEEETFNLTSHINGGGTLWAAIVNGPCREAIPITVNFNDPQGTISVAPRICADDGQISLTFNTTTAGNLMINLATDENDGNGFALASGNPYTVADGDLIVLTAGVDYDAAAVQAAAAHSLSIQLQRIEDASGCFLDGLTTTVTTLVDPSPQVLLRSNATTVASGHSVSVCNGSPAGYSLRLTANNPDDLVVEYLVTDVTMVPPMSVDLSAAWQLNTAYAATASPYPTETPVPTPTLANGALSGAVTYEITPRTTNENCEANPITFTIQLEETPDVFVVEGITEDTLCDGTAPSLTLATNFFPNDDVEFTIAVIDDDTGDGDDGVTGGVNQVIDGAVAVYDPINNYSTFNIPDILTNADADGTVGDEYQAQTIHYRITVNRKNPPGPNCGLTDQLDLFFTILPDAFDLLTFTNNELGICSGANSDLNIGLTVEGNEFVGPVEGGPHKIRLSISPAMAPNANNPSMIAVPAASTITFGNDLDGPDDIAGNADDEVLSFDIADLFANASGDYARVAYNFEATLITPNGAELCTHVFPAEFVRVRPEPVLEQTALTSVCSGTAVTVVDLVSENPVSATGVTPAIQNVTADWSITNLPAGVTASVMMGTEQVTPAMAGAVTTLTNTTTSPQVVSFEFAPQNMLNCTGTTLQVNLTVNPLPDGDISFAAGNESICEGENIQLDFTTTTEIYPIP